MDKTLRSESGRRRLAVVTGGAASIGQAYAQRLAQDGHDVVIADLQAADETIGLVEAAGGVGTSIRCDVSREDDVASLLDEVMGLHGAADVLVHNAGIYPIHKFEDITFTEWKRVFAVNVDSLFLLTRAFLPPMRQKQWGRIVAQSTTAFHAGVPGFVHYVASKGAVIGFIRTLASEVGVDGVTVNSIAPGLVRTQGTTSGPHDRMGLFEEVINTQAIKRTQVPSDLVGALSYLVSDEASFVTGQTFAVDGGFVRT